MVNRAVGYHRDFYPMDMNGCVFYLPFWRYGANAQKIWDQSGQGNHGTITGAAPYPGGYIIGDISEDQTGSTFNRGDFTATNSFFWSSLDLSPYAGTDLGSTPYYIEILDAAGKKATGYIGAVGAGEGLGNEQNLNPGFDSDTVWAEGTGWTILGGVAVGTAAPVSSELYQAVTFIVGGLYKKTADFVVTSGSVALRIYIINGITRTTSGTFSDYIEINSNWGADTVASNHTVISTFTGTVDNSSLKRVTDPPSTAVHIVSSLNGTVRNWESIESGFDPNTIASWKIYKMIRNAVIGWYFDNTDDLISHASINFGKTHTLLYWIEPSANEKHVVHGGAANNHIAIDGTNIYYNAGATELSQAHSGGMGGPVMIGIVRSGTTVQFFKNGVQVGVDQTLDANNDLTLTTLGSYGTPGTFFGGVTLEDSGFTRAFSVQEIKSYFDNTRHIYGV